MRPENDGSGRPLTRRAVVAGGGAVALGVVVSACGDQGDGTADGGAPGGIAAGSVGSVLGPASEIPIGGGKIFEALEVVVTQPTAGDFQGFSAVCTHTGCIVNKIAGGTINCPCHGSRYNLDGTVASGPAPRALPSRPVSVADGQVVLT